MSSLLCSAEVLWHRDVQGVRGSCRVESVYRIQGQRRDARVSAADTDHLLQMDGIVVGDQAKRSQLHVDADLREFQH